MGRIIYLPFEELPQRYTAMWNWAIENELSSDDIIVNVLGASSVINEGEFLDTFGTIKHKEQQIQQVAQLFERGEIKDGDIFFIPDIFFHGMEAIKYMAELSGVKVKIAAFNHAGRADKNDFVQKLSSWADVQEQAWHDMTDLVLVGSKHHQAKVQRTFNHKNVVVTGAVWDSRWMDIMCEGISREKEDFVIFPHRPCKEKRFNMFLQIAKNNPSTRFVITSCGNNRLQDIELPRNVEYKHNLTKKQYFEVFAKAKFYLSTAKQETFGYTIQEAIYFGCDIVAINDACIPEYVGAGSIFSKSELLLKNLFYNNMNIGANLRSCNQFENNAKRIVKLIRNI